MEKRQKRLAVLLRQAGVLALAGTLFWTRPFPVFATSQAEREKQEAQRRLEEANERAEEARQNMNQAQTEVTSLSNELAVLIADLSLLETDIEYKNGQIRQAQSEYDLAMTKEIGAHV